MHGEYGKNKDTFESINFMKNSRWPPKWLPKPHKFMYLLNHKFYLTKIFKVESCGRTVHLCIDKVS